MCIFCKIIAGEIPCYKVYEDDQNLAFLDVFPRVYAHTLVIPKKHYETLDIMEAEEAKSFMIAVKKTSQILKDKLDIKAYNILSNNGEESGQEVPHLHFHILGRKKEDGIPLRFPPVIEIYKESLSEIHKKFQ